MSKNKNRPVDRRHSGATESKRFETKTVAENLFDARELPLEMHIYSWTPKPNGEGPCTQVHLVARIPGISDIRFAMRFKSAEALDEFVDKLIEHKLEVWPPQQ
jgi:hypothetical protein